MTQQAAAPTIPDKALASCVGLAAIKVVFVVSLIWTALYLAWGSLSSANFLFPVWYEVLDIGEHIDHYGPQNYYKPDFASTDRAQRLALFGEIVEAINRSGEGLGEIRYRTEAGREIVLLRDPERIHLESVGRIIDRLRLVSYVMLGVLAATGFALWRAAAEPPRPSRVLLWSMVVTVTSAVAIVAYGAEEVFNFAHEVIFPPASNGFSTIRSR
ncbi:hypothetical protein CAI21_01005 [Alkalilimnicola ehrlichii]|uniref:DUF1461 domain-containing protein n=1 Tax=Alkalilimnicola ehrlichii TaxID=351052 RepID=UPI000E2E4B9B|nr:DUF1461 domain-containing protein [Alkalilimnicola ehrlichii]RFA31251.1 hypothetical protein CAI21_01005 [Alkalilimnicola ehrlichii]